MDNLFEQFTNISKAGAYDAIAPEFEKLKLENEKIKRLLHDLTPGGSEFYNDPEYCARWIRDNREANHYTLAKMVAELKADKAQLEIMLKGEKDRVEALRNFINEVRPQNPELIPLDGDTEKEIEQEMKDHDDLRNIDI